MIVVVEGPTAAGKTSWVTTHHSRVAVWEYRSSGDEPDRSADPEGAARYWASANAGRWQQALGIEMAHGLAVCDTDPFKLHYVWGLWWLGEVDTSMWEAEARMNREHLEAGRLGFADLVLCEIPDLNVLQSRQDGDRTRTRRNFDLHVHLAEPLRRWYETMDELEPGRVRWTLPPDGSIPDPPRPQFDRSELKRFDDFLSALPRPKRPPPTSGD